MALVLLYNLTYKEKFTLIRFALLKLGLPWREVKPEEYALPLGQLAGLDVSVAEEEETTEVFRDEMLVMCGLEQGKFHAFLDQLRRSRARVALKAVLTESNAAWSSFRLHREIAAEHEAMKNISSTRKARQNSRHKS